MTIMYHREKPLYLLINKHMILQLLFIGLISVLALAPPKTIPHELLDQYTLNGTVTIENFYVDDTNNGSRTHFSYSNQSIEMFVRGADRMHGKILKMMDTVRNSRQLMKNPITEDEIYDVVTSILPKDNWLQVATIKHSYMFVDNNKETRAIVFGSMEPWEEAWILHMGVSKVVTVEYNYLTYNHSDMTTITVDEFKKRLDDGEFNNYFDFAFAISSFDHDGLGRYGDPLNPNADVEAMNICWKILKIGNRNSDNVNIKSNISNIKIISENNQSIVNTHNESNGESSLTSNRNIYTPNTGVLFLTLPIGKTDILVWNLHRIYSPTNRLKYMLSDYDVIDIIGWDEDRVNKKEDFRKRYEPVFVLKPKLLTLDNKPPNSNSPLHSEL